MTDKYDINKLRIGQDLYRIKGSHNGIMSLETLTISHIGKDSVALMCNPTTNLYRPDVCIPMDMINTYPIEDHVSFDKVNKMPSHILDIVWFITKEEAKIAMNHLNKLRRKEMKEEKARWVNLQSFNKRVDKLRNRLIYLVDNKKNREVVEKVEKLLGEI